MTSANNFSSLLDRHFKMNQDYAVDLVQDLFDQEKYIEVLENYYEIIQVNEVNPKMRTKLVEWMIQLGDEMKLGYKTKQTAVIMMDMILSKLKIHKKYLQLLGITVIFIAIKEEESFIYKISHACEHCANAYTNEEVSAMEMLVLKTLRWKLQYPTAGEISRRLVQLANPVLGVNLANFFKKTDNFIDLVISEFDSSVYSPTVIAVATVMCSFENSLIHIGKWRAVMIENFNFDFTTKIDGLYQHVVQKLTKFYPDLFQFPSAEEFAQLINEYVPVQQNNDNVPQDQMQGGLGYDTNNNNNIDYQGINPPQQEVVEANNYQYEQNANQFEPLQHGTQMEECA